jgi:hypothetical protein
MSFEVIPSYYHSHNNLKEETGSKGPINDHQPISNEYFAAETTIRENIETSTISALEPQRSQV